MVGPVPACAQGAGAALRVADHRQVTVEHSAPRVRVIATTIMGTAAGQVVRSRGEGRPRRAHFARLLRFSSQDVMRSSAFGSKVVEIVPYSSTSPVLAGWKR